MSRPQAVVYPDSDGKPMTDSDANRRLMVNVEFALQQLFRQDPRVYVSADLFVYFRAGAPGARIAPDVFVVKDVEKKLRGRFLLWEEGQPPSVVFEFLSPSTRKRDLLYKPRRYASLGVREYYCFDEGGLWIPERLLCSRLCQGEMRTVSERYSPELDLELRVAGSDLRLVHQGRLLLTPDEERQRADAESERADAEARRVRELEAELRRLRGEG